MSKRVVILHPAHWEQAIGGAELQIKYFANYLLDEGFEVYFIFINGDGTITNNLDVFLHPLKKIRLSKRFGSKWFFYRKKIFKKLNEIKPDLIYTRLYSSWSGFASIYAKHNKIKHFWAIASDNDVRKRNSFELLLNPFNFVEKHYVNYSFQHASQIITQNLYQTEEIKKRYNTNVIFIPKGTEIHGEQKTEKDFSKLKVIWVANLKDVKRPDLFIEIVKNLKNYSNIEFTMIGRQSVKFKKLIEDSVRKFKNFEFLGEIPNKKLHNILSKHHVLLNVSNYEAFPNTFLEAWANRLIVISRNVNPNGVLSNNNIGFVCNTVKEITHKLIFLNNNKEHLKEMTDEAYNYVLKYHSNSKNIKKLISLI